MPIYLSFDDCHIKEWFSYRDWFIDNRVFATFYVSNLKTITDPEWGKLQLLKQDGHCIAFHSTNHRRAGLTGVPEDDPMRHNRRLANEVFYRTWSEYLEHEILWGVRFMRERGLEPHHFAYPWGNSNGMTDTELLQVFVTLRNGGKGYYATKPSGRIVTAMLWGKYPKQLRCGHEGTLMLLNQHYYLFPYLHEPVAHRLQYLADAAKLHNAEFLTFDDLFGTEVPL